MSAVYFARVGDYVKIGFASNPTQRAKTLLTGRLIVPEDLDRSLKVELVLVIPSCRMRDERNLHLLFARHWAVGEWFHWTPEFRYQMTTMRFVTHATRQRDLRAARRDLGITAGPAKEAKWGKTARDLIADSHLARAS